MKFVSRECAIQGTRFAMQRKLLIHTSSLSTLNTHAGREVPSFACRHRRGFRRFLEDHILEISSFPKGSCRMKSSGNALVKIIAAGLVPP